MYLYASNKDGWTAFMFACSNGHKDVLQVHLDYSNRGIDLNAKSHRGMTRGMTAFMIASHPKMLSEYSLTIQTKALIRMQ